MQCETDMTQFFYVTLLVFPYLYQSSLLDHDKVGFHRCIIQWRTGNRDL